MNRRNQGKGLWSTGSPNSSLLGRNAMRARGVVIEHRNTISPVLDNGERMPTIRNCLGRLTNCTFSYGDSCHQ